MIATFTGVSHEEGGLQFIPSPAETVATYGDVFGLIGVIAVGAGVFLLLISPFLRRGMHIEELEHDAEAEQAEHASRGAVST